MIFKPGWKIASLITAFLLLLPLFSFSQDYKENVCKKMTPVLSGMGFAPDKAYADCSGKFYLGYSGSVTKTNSFPQYERRDGRYERVSERRNLIRGLNYIEIDLISRQAAQRKYETVDIANTRPDAEYKLNTRKIVDGKIVSPGPVSIKTEQEGRRRNYGIYKGGLVLRRASGRAVKFTGYASGWLLEEAEEFDDIVSMTAFFEFKNNAGHEFGISISTNNQKRDYHIPGVPLITEDQVNAIAEAYAGFLTAELAEPAEREVRFVDEENMWSPDDPLTLNVAIEEKIDGEWQARTPKSRARLAARPVYLVVTMRDMIPSSALDRRWRDSLLGDNGRLIAAYSDDSGNASTNKRLRFDRAYGFGSRYEVRGWEGGLSIDLRDGESLPAKLSGGAWLPDSEGRGDREAIDRFRLAYDRTVELLERVQTRRPDSEGMEFPPEWRRLRASVQVEAFEYANVRGGNGTARREWRRLATSKLIPIWIDHVARLVWAGALIIGSAGITVHRAGHDKFTVPPEEMGDKLPSRAEYKLLAGDQVTLGSQDRVQIQWVLRADDKWWIRANTGALAAAGRKDVSFVIGGKGGTSVIRSAGVIVFIADWGLSILINSVGPGPGSNYLIGWVAGSVTGRLDPGALAEWHLVTPNGTRLGFDLERSGPRVYLFEGSASVENKYGGVVRLKEGQMSTSLGQRGYSATVEFRTEDLSASLRASLADAVRGSQPGTGTLPIPGARATELRFYEAGFDSPPLDERRYAKRFPRSETQFVWFELHLEYPEPGRRIEFPIESVWYGPDGGILDRKSFGGHVKADWDDSFHWDGWRPGDKGAWEPGEYRVEVFMEGQKVASGFYEIYEGETESTNIPIPDAKIIGVKFYESGYDQTPFGQRTYKEKFSKSESRYINWELGLIFPPPGRRIDFDIDAAWYRPDGSVVARQTKKAYVESAWKDSFHNLGWGWKSPGNWQPGKYRVELFIDGQKIAEGFFEIGNL